VQYDFLLGININKVFGMRKCRVKFLGHRRAISKTESFTYMNIGHVDPALRPPLTPLIQRVRHYLTQI
jgi:hypothetical protein